MKCLAQIFIKSVVKFYIATELVKMSSMKWVDMFEREKNLSFLSYNVVLEFVVDLLHDVEYV